jgi:hypothetical protein
MSEEIEIAGIKVPQVDWAATPASIQALVVVLSERLQQQDDRIRHLEERLNQNSKVIGHSNKEGLMRKPSKPQDHPGKRAGGEHPDEAMSSKRWSTAFLP